MRDAGAAGAARLIADMEALRGRPCTGCARPLCGHEAVVSILLGFKNAAHCLPCLAARLGNGGGTLRDHVLQHIRHRDCYLQGWLAASRHEGFGPAVRPACLFDGDGHAGSIARATKPMTQPSDTPAADVEWDAGDMGCGELVLELRLRLQAMTPGRVLKVTARDSGAPEDLPAWCGMTGHILLKAAHPEYWIRRRES